MSKNAIATIIVIVLIVGSGAFYGGMRYQESKQPTAANVAARFAGGAGGTQSAGSGAIRTGATGMRTGGGFIAGDIIAKDAQSVTVQLSNGGSQIVFLSGSTQIIKATAGVLDDLVVDMSAAVTGTSNTDGSINAQSVQIRPAGMNFSGGRNGRTNGAVSEETVVPVQGQ